MGDSDGSWGELAQHDDELAEAWDGFSRLPDAGENAALDAFVERKRISLASLVRLGARLADDQVLAFAFPGGIKFRDVVTDKRWAYIGSSFKQLKIVRSGRERAARVIVCEGETDGAWLTDRVVGVDVAILPAGADPRPHAQLYAKQLQDYELVLLGQDSDRAGDEGAAQLAELLPQAHRLKPGGNDWCSTEDDAIEIPMPEDFEPRGELVGGLFFENLTELLSDGVPDPDILVDDVLYTEGVHWVSGHPESGKTTLAMHLAIMVMSEGRHVVWLDYEGGTRPTVRRLLSCQCPLELAVTHFHYAGWPTDAVEYFGDVAARWPGALIILDSASKALQMAGLDENSPGEVTKWAAPIVKECKTHTLPIIVIDHVTKVATRDTRYARGAGSKLADSDVAWFVHKHTPFTREEIGLIGVYRQKDREGFMPAASWYTVGDGHGALTMMPSEPPIDTNEDDEQGPAI